MALDKCKYQQWKARSTILSIAASLAVQATMVHESIDGDHDCITSVFDL